MKRKTLTDLIPLRNPIMLASGPLGRNAASLIKYGQFAGGLVSKSVTWLPCKGNPRPRVTRVGEWGLINWEGLPNPGYEAFCHELSAAKAVCTVPIIASIGPAESVEQLQAIAVALEEAGAYALELDFKWATHIEDNTLQRITKGVRSVKEAVTIPVIAKLSPYMGDIVENALAVEEAGADAITAINSVYPAMRIDVRRQRPALASGCGGLSGRPILPIAVAMIYQIYEAVKVPILGSGGVISGEDALQMIMAGAQAVQICTVAILEGPRAFRRINDELEALVREIGFESVEACCGVVHEAYG